MASPAEAALTWSELQTWPDDGLRYELIDGALQVSPAPSYRHQRVVNRISADLTVWADQHGGQVLSGPFDVYVHEREYVEPDLLFVCAERVHLFTERRLPAPPDLVVEVSSPSTHSVDAGAKRDLYERFAVPEYWLVDLDADMVLVHRLGAGAGGYAVPSRRARGDVLDCVGAPGFDSPVARILDA
ncbi:Uma2 family endonuclease [soil metagenome]|jgi:Uma2 family endonuclease